MNLIVKGSYWTLGNWQLKQKKLWALGNWLPKPTSCGHRATGSQSWQAAGIGQLAAKAHKLWTLGKWRPKLTSCRREVMLIEWPSQAAKARATDVMWCWLTDHGRCSMIDVWKRTEIIRVNKPVFIGAWEPWSLVISWVLLRSAVLVVNREIQRYQSGLPEHGKKRQKDATIVCIWKCCP